jgi:hypothetical protein
MNEIEIRKLLICHLEASASGAAAAFISELFIDKFSRRADLVMANGKLSVFEIKSERDTIDRLKGQVSTYQDFFEEVTVVCAPKHQLNVVSTVPERVGIWLIDCNGRLSILRKAKAKKLPSIHNWLTFLPVDELSNLLKESGRRSTGNRTSLMEIASLLPLKQVRSYVLIFLKRRHKRLDELREKKSQKKILTQEGSLNLSSTQLQDYINSSSCTVFAIPRRISL